MKIINNYLISDVVRMIWLSELNSMELKKLPMKTLFVACETPLKSGYFQFKVAPCYVSGQDCYEEVNPYLCVSLDDVSLDDQSLFETKCHVYSSIGEGFYEEDVKVFAGRKNSDLLKVNQKCKKL